MEDKSKVLQNILKSFISGNHDKTISLGKKELPFETKEAPKRKTISDMEPKYRTL